MGAVKANAGIGEEGEAGEEAVECISEPGTQPGGG